MHCAMVALRYEVHLVGRLRQTLVNRGCERVRMNRETVAFRVPLHMRLQHTTT